MWFLVAGEILTLVGEGKEMVRHFMLIVNFAKKNLGVGGGAVWFFKGALLSKNTDLPEFPRPYTPGYPGIFITNWASPAPRPPPPQEMIISRKMAIWQQATCYVLKKQNWHPLLMEQLINHKNNIKIIEF